MRRKWHGFYPSNLKSCRGTPAGSLIVEDCLRGSLSHFELCAHILQARGERFNLFLLLCNHRSLLLNLVVCFEKIVCIGSFGANVNNSCSRRRVGLERGNNVSWIAGAI